MPEVLGLDSTAVKRKSNDDWGRCLYEAGKGNVDWGHSVRWVPKRRPVKHVGSVKIVNKRRLERAARLAAVRAKLLREWDRAHSAKDIEVEFNLLADRWERETRNISSPRVIVKHPAAQEIVALGDDVVPMILLRMVDRPWFWFELLMRITKEPIDPITDNIRGDMQKMTEAWLKWGADRGII